MKIDTLIQATAILAVAGLAASAQGQFIINEVFINPPGTDGVGPIEDEDEGSGGAADYFLEYVEIAGVVGDDLNGLVIAFLTGGGGGEAKEVDEAFQFVMGDELVARGGPDDTGYFVLYHADGDEAEMEAFVNGSLGTSFTDLDESNGFGEFEDRELGGSAGRLQNNGSTTIALLRIISTAAAWDKDSPTENAGEVGVLHDDMFVYQILDEVSWGNEGGEEYDRFDNEISETPGFQPDAITRVHYYCCENPERGWVENLYNESPTKVWVGTSIADESWIAGDVNDFGSVAGNNIEMRYDTTDHVAPSDYDTDIFDKGRYAEQVAVPGTYNLTPGGPNEALKSGSASPFKPALGQVSFRIGDVNFDGLVNCADESLIEVSVGTDLDERLTYDDEVEDGDYRWQGCRLNQLLAMARLASPYDEITAADVTAWGMLTADACDSSGVFPAHRQTEEEAQRLRGDVDGDGVTTVRDMLLILQQLGTDTE